MTHTPRVRWAFVTLVRCGVLLLVASCAGGPDWTATDTPTSVAVTWVSAWAHRDVAAMCRVETVHARGGEGSTTCETRLLGVTGASDIPWTYGRPGAVQRRRVSTGTAAWVSVSDTGHGGHSFDWALLMHRAHDGRWLVDDYHRITGPASVDPLSYYYGGNP